MIDRALEWASNLSTFAAAFAVVWAVYEFLKKNREESEQRRADNVRRWRDARAHYELERAGASGLSFIEYKEKMHSSAFGKDGDKVEKSELDDETLRLVLLSLIEQQAIETFGDTDDDGPRYRVHRANSANDIVMNNTAALPEILEIVRTQTGQYTDAGIANKLRKFAIGEVQMRAILLQMYQYGLVFQSDDGRWHIQAEQGRFPPLDVLAQISEKVQKHTDEISQLNQILRSHEHAILALQQSSSPEHS